MTLAPKENPAQANAREVIKQSTHEKMTGMVYDRARQSAQDILEHAEDPEWIQERYNKKAAFILQRMTQVAERINSGFESSNWDARVEEAFTEDQEGVKEELRAIRAKFALPVPDPEDPSSESTPYLANHPITGVIRGVRIPEFHITRAVEKDIDFLQKALRKNLTSAQKGTIQELISALETYEQYDEGRLAKKIITQTLKNNYTDRAINKMGRITLTMAAGAAAVSVLGIGGLHMLTKEKVKGEMFGKELLPGAGITGLFLFMANPGWVKSILGNRKERALNELSASVCKPEFKKTLLTHDIEGEAGTQLAGVLRDKTPSVAESVDRCANGTATTKDIDMLVAKTTPPKATEKERTNLTKLWIDPKAIDTLRTIRTLTDKDAVAVATDLLTLGVGSFYKKAKKIERDFSIQREMERQRVTPLKKDEYRA